MKRRLSTVTIVFACALAAALAQTLPPGVQKKASMGGHHRIRLSRTV